MSRIILSKHEDGTEHVVVGWDHPAGGAFWQEYASKAEIAEHLMDEAARLGTNPSRQIAETGLKRYGGMWPGISLDDLRPSMPEELQPLVTSAVIILLYGHSQDADSGLKPVWDMSPHAQIS